MKDPACGVRAGPLSRLWFCFPLPGVPSSKHWENWLHCSPIAFYYEFHPHSPLPSLTPPALTFSFSDDIVSNNMVRSTVATQNPWGQIHFRI